MPDGSRRGCTTPLKTDVTARRGRPHAGAVRAVRQDYLRKQLPRPTAVASEMGQAEVARLRVGACSFR